MSWIKITARILNSTAPLEPSSVSRIAVLVKTYGEMDPIQLAWMVNQMESYSLRCRSLDVPGTGTLFLGTVVLALHLVHQRHKAVGVQQLREKVTLSN
ncbi:MAG: hypothetical protein R6U98_05155 [Pirellulaceae bacterium]